MVLHTLLQAILESENKLESLVNIQIDGESELRQQNLIQLKDRIWSEVCRLLLHVQCHVPVCDHGLTRVEFWNRLTVHLI